MRAKATGGEAWRGRTLARVRAAHGRKETVPTSEAYLSAAERRGGASWAGERELGRRDWAARGEKGKEKGLGQLRRFGPKEAFFSFFCKRFKQIQFEFKFEEFKFKLKHNIKTMQG